MTATSSNPARECQPDCAALRQKLAEYAQDLRRNPSGGDDYPWEIMRAVADRIDDILRSSTGTPQPRQEYPKYSPDDPRSDTL